MSTLLIASTGGHLAQLHQLRPRLRGIDPDVTWVTFDTPQSRALLAGEDVVFVEHTLTRDYRHVITNTVPAAKLLRDRDVTGVVSTGAAIALSFLPLARARRLPTHYIESATRSSGPSTTGRLLQHVPGINLYAQHEAWADDRWSHAGSVFDGYQARTRRFARVRRVVVTLGAHRGYGFRRLLERLVAILPPEAEVLWQTGSTDVSGLPIDATPFLPGDELEAAMRDADLVIGHAGIGSALAALQAGRCPLLVPRDPAHGEHVDGHQLEIAAALRDRDLAVVRTVEELDLDDLVLAASTKMARTELPPAFALGDGQGTRPAPTKVASLAASR